MALLSILLSLIISNCLANNYIKYDGQQCWGTGTDILRDYTGNAGECMAKCDELNCVGFIRVNSGSGYAGDCFFRGEGLQEPYPYTNDDRDCYAADTAYTKYPGQQCWGTGTDILRDFEGTAEECKALCDEMNCIGFIRVNSGSQYAGKCYFRGEGMQAPIDYNNDDRDCYVANTRYRIHKGQQCWGTGTDILRDYTATAEQCKLKCRALDGCVGFIRVNSGSGYAGDCFFRGGSLQAPYDYANDERDCYEPVEPANDGFLRYEGQQCWGTGTDILRDYTGTAEQCKKKCVELNCVGFVRVNSGSGYAGDCFFRGEGLQDPYPYTNDDRDCFRNLGVVQSAGAQQVVSPGDEGMGFDENKFENNFENNNYENKYENRYPNSYGNVFANEKGYKDYYMTGSSTTMMIFGALVVVVLVIDIIIFIHQCKGLTNGSSPKYNGDSEY